VFQVIDADESLMFQAVTPEICGAEFNTLTVTGVAAVMLPESSRAMADTV
jgi:hypothetical protein